MSDTQAIQVKSVKLSDINFGAQNLRSHNPEADYILESADDLRRRGLLNVFSVVPDDEDGKYRIKDGSKRLTALKLIYEKDGKLPENISEDGESIIVKIDQAQSPIETLADQIAGNAQVRKTANKDFINGIYQVAITGSMSMEELATHVGMNLNYMKNLLKTLKLGEEVLTMAEEKNVSIANLITLKDMANLIDNEEMTEWVEKASTTPAKEFADVVTNEIDRIKAEAAGGPKREKGYVHVPTLLKKDELKMLLIQTENEFTKEPTPVNEARYQLMKEIWQSDEESIAAGQAEYERKEEERAQKAKERKAAREQAKLKEYATKLEEEGYEVKAKDSEETEA